MSDKKLKLTVEGFLPFVGSLKSGVALNFKDFEGSEDDLLAMIEDALAAMKRHLKHRIEQRESFPSTEK